MAVTIDNNHLQNLNILGSITGDPYFEGYLQQLGSGPVTIDNNGLQNLIRLGPVFADAGKAAGHSVLDSLNGSFLQNMQVNSVIDNAPLQNLQFGEIAGAVGVGIASKLGAKAIEDGAGAAWNHFHLI